MTDSGTGKRIALVGAGAVGSNVGGLLTRAGLDVTLIDPWPDHVEAMRTDGLHVELKEEQVLVPVKALHLHEVCTLAEPFDLVILACKSYDTRWLAELIKPYTVSNAVFVSLQNSINEEWLMPIVGYQNTLGCVLSISCELWEPGRASRNTSFDRITFTVGEPSGRLTARLSELADMLSHAGGSSVTQNLWGARWSKLVLNTMGMPMAAITGMMTREVVLDDDCMEACLALGTESLRVGRALGYDIEPIFGLRTEDLQTDPRNLLRKLITTLAARIGDARGTIWYDLRKGRRTETSFLCGLVADKARDAGLEAPMNEAMVRVMTSIERKGLAPDRSNVRLLFEHAEGGVDVPVADAAPVGASDHDSDAAEAI